MFYGYYFSLATMVNDEGGTAVPELVRRVRVSSCHLDPVPTFLPALVGLFASGVRIGDVLANSGYAHRRAEHFAVPLRRLGARLVIDLHPHDRGQQGTFSGAVLANGNCYCPATPPSPFGLGSLARTASAEETRAHDEKTAELSRYKLSRITSDDEDGYHRVSCPAVTGKLRCPLRPGSMALSFKRPEVL